MKRSSPTVLALACAALMAGHASLAAEPAKPTLSAAQTRGVAELARCQRAAYLNRVARERLSNILSGPEALRNFDDMAKMQDYTRQLDAWFAELIGYYGEEQLLRLLPPDRAADKAFLKDESSTEARSRAMVSATAREANVCLSGKQTLQRALSAD